MQTDNKLYIYPPLEEDDLIRILYLEQVDDGSLQARLEHVKLGSANFIALSYCWGKSDQPFRMSIKNEHGEHEGYIPLTQNLVHALENLRDTPEITPKVFWIDQIAINQKDHDERAHQVTLMARIFTEATQVITYLGPKQPHDEDAIQLARTIHSIFKPYHQELLEWNNWEIANRDPWSSLVAQLPPTSHPGWQALTSLACGQWTTRLWMVAENILNPNTVMLRGNQLLDWTLVASVPVLQSSGMLPGIPNQDDVEITGYRAFIMWQARVRRLNERKWHQKLSLLIAKFRFHKCQDPRDSVYSLLSISSDSDQLGLEPDYHSYITKEMLYTRLTMSTIQMTRNLEILSSPAFGSDCEINYKLPTWVPDFPVPMQVQPIARPEHSASGALQLKHHFTSNSELDLEGLPVDKITEVLVVFNEPLTQLFVEGEVSQQLRSNFKLLVSNLKQLVTVDGLPATSVLSHTLVASNWQPGEEIQPECNAAEALDHFVIALDDFAQRDDFESKGEGSKADQKALQIAQHFTDCALVQYRALCRTAANRLCLAPRAVRADDQITVLFGGNHLYILRPGDDGVHGYVGDAYIHGLMQGQALDDENHVDRVQTFRLR